MNFRSIIILTSLSMRLLNAVSLLSYFYFLYIDRPINMLKSDV
jgi:hypothetical protein